MNIPGTRILHPAVRRLQKRFLASPKGLILMYHSIAEVDLDPWALCVTPQHFAQHLEVLQKYAHPISLQQLAQAHRHGDIPDRAVAITFDDGYANNLHNAKPLLEKYGISATVFVTTGYIGQNREFWWDELERIWLQPGRLPRTLSLRLNGCNLQWELGEASYYSEADYQRDCERKAWEGHRGSRLGLYYSVWQKLRTLPEDERRKAINDIKLWANDHSEIRSTHRALFSEEIGTVAGGGLIEIGAHTVTHTFIPEQTSAVQQDEIQQSKVSLEKLLNYPVNSFAYPFGHYTPETVNLVRLSGFNCACSCIQETVWSQSNSFELPRFEVQNWNGDEFSIRLRRWFHA